MHKTFWIFFSGLQCIRLGCGARPEHLALDAPPCDFGLFRPLLRGVAAPSPYVAKHVRRARAHMKGVCKGVHCAPILGVYLKMCTHFRCVFKDVHPY